MGIPIPYWQPNMGEGMVPLPFPFPHPNSSKQTGPKGFPARLNTGLNGSVRTDRGPYGYRPVRLTPLFKIQLKLKKKKNNYCGGVHRKLLSIGD